MNQSTIPYLLNSVDLAYHLKQVKQTFSDLEKTLSLRDSNEFKNHINQKEYYIYLFNKLVECEYLNLRLCRLHQSQYLPQKQETYSKISTLKSTIQVKETTTFPDTDSLSMDSMKTKWTSESVWYKNDIESSFNPSHENLKDIELYNKEFRNLWEKLKCFREQLGQHINILEKDTTLTPFELEKLLHRVRRMHLINVEWLVQLNLKHLSKYDNLILFMKYVMELTHTSTPEDCINALSKLFKPSLFKPLKIFQSQTTAVCPSLKVAHRWTKVITLANIPRASTQSFRKTEIIPPLTDSKPRSSKSVGFQDTSTNRTESNDNETDVNKIETESLCVTHIKSHFPSTELRERSCPEESARQKCTCFTVSTSQNSDHLQPVDEAILSRESINATDSVLSCAKFHRLTFTEALSFQNNDSMSLQVDTKENIFSTRNSQSTSFHKISKDSLATTASEDVFNKHVHENISSTLSKKFLTGKCVIQQKSDMSNNRKQQINARGSKTLNHLNDNLSKSSFITSSSITDTNECTSAFFKTKKETQMPWTHNLQNMDKEEQAIFKDLLKSQTVWEKELSFNKKDYDLHSNWMKTALLQSFTNDERVSPKLQTIAINSSNENDTLGYSKQVKTAMHSDPQETHLSHTPNPPNSCSTSIKHLSCTRSDHATNLPDTCLTSTKHLSGTRSTNIKHPSDTRSTILKNPCDTRSMNMQDFPDSSWDIQNGNVGMSLKYTNNHPSTRWSHSQITRKQYRKHNHFACQKTIHNYRLMYRDLIHETYDACLNENMKLFSLWIGLSLNEECCILPFSTSTLNKPVTCEILEAYVTSNLLFAQPLPSTTPSCGLWKLFDSIFCTNSNFCSKKSKLKLNSLPEKRNRFI